MAIESKADGSLDADEIVLNFVQRGINNVDVVIGKGVKSDLFRCFI